MRRTRDSWVEIVRQCERSGVTQEAFAEERGIPVTTLRSWIYRLRREKQPKRQSKVPLLPVRVITSPAPTARGWESEAGPIEVELGEVLRLRFPSGTPASVIAELVVLLRARC